MEGVEVTVVSTEGRAGTEVSTEAKAASAANGERAALVENVQTVDIVEDEAVAEVAEGVGMPFEFCRWLICSDWTVG